MNLPITYPSASRRVEQPSQPVNCSVADDPLHRSLNVISYFANETTDEAIDAAILVQCAHSGNLLRQVLP